MHSFFIISFDEPYFLVRVRVYVSRINLRDKVENGSSLFSSSFVGLEFCVTQSIDQRFIFFIENLIDGTNVCRKRVKIKEYFSCITLYIYIQNPTTISRTTFERIPLNWFSLAKKHNVRPRVRCFQRKHRPNTPSKPRYTLVRSSKKHCARERVRTKEKSSTKQRDRSLHKGKDS